LLRAIDESGAECVWVTHGYRAPMVRWLEEHGRKAQSVEARFEEDEP
jgi:putative mRNA 3-end processing factor